MSTKHSYLTLLVLVSAIQPWFPGRRDDAGLATAAAESITTGELDPRLKLTRDALLDKGSSDEMRLNAATVMLLSEDPLARQILLDALKQSGSEAVRRAVCKALIRAGTNQQPLKNVSDFEEPLLAVFAAEDPATARLAAEATLIFGYESIAEPLGKLINDGSAALNARIAAIYALELHPDVRAAVALVKMVDYPQKELAAEARKALEELGIPPGDDPRARRQVINDLLTAGQTAFLQKRLIRKEARIRAARAELKAWQDRYLRALDDLYTAISDDTRRAKFLAEHLADPETAVRLWALDKIRQDRVGTRRNPKLPAEVGPILTTLVSAEDRQVRLKTAIVLSFMTEVNSAEQLLAQIEDEQDPQVRAELLGALGRACYIAFLPNSKIKIAPEIRKQTLNWAVRFLSEQSPADVQKGAEVIKLLLEQDGLDENEAQRYLQALLHKYKALNSDSDASLRAELLNAMAGLCAPQSTRRVQAKKLFGPLFGAALAEKTDLVREAAVDGLIYIDKSAALKRLRTEFTDDPSVTIRKKLIALAGEVGTREDLPWLAAKIGSNSESEPAWQAMLKIFNGSDAAVLEKWLSAFLGENAGIGASEGQKIAFLEIAERKAATENKPKMLTTVRKKLAELYAQTGQFEKAAEYLGRLYEAAPDPEAKKGILPDLLQVYLHWPKIDLAAKLVESCLAVGDLDPNNAVVRSLEGFFAEPPAGTDPNLLLDALGRIKPPPEPRPMWQERFKQWIIRFGKAKAVDKSEPDGT